MKRQISFTFIISNNLKQVNSQINSQIYHLHIKQILYTAMPYS
ncbi:hypothetical protein VCHA50O407_20064 [Vibrio chagasii]|nr:hypothetical protein VCHA50O407_20064 [Vibrio chagasii]CAH7284566.1 hypothetical protein VCHA50P424_30205 [Vibrio chagasii]